MAALPSPTQVAGHHAAVYEAYYSQVDPDGSGVIKAIDAARFLKKSKLSDVVLSRVWDLSDPSGRGYLDKSGLFVALKLVALAQSGKEIAIANVHSETPPPKLGELPKVRPPPVVASSEWSIKPAEKDKYERVFESLQPSDGLVPGNKVKGMLMESKLPVATLGKIWDLADQDKDGMLDRHEFVVAMHLVYKALEKHAIPATLPPELRPPSKVPPVRPPSRPPSPLPARPPPPISRPPPAQIERAMDPAPLIPGLADPPRANLIHAEPVVPTLAAPIRPSAAPEPWVVTPSEKIQYDALFTKADVDMDGFVSGLEIKDTFLQSGLPQPCLAHIWSLCDWDGSGKLSRDQFALAMWMVQRKLRGIDPPAALAPDMIPPSARSPATRPAEEKELNLGPQPTPEMEALARDMERLAKERLSLESEVTSKEHNIRVKSSEADSLQSELDTLAATLKQLENQRGEAQKRLNELQNQVEKLDAQAKAQESSVRQLESETMAKKDALQGLKQQEQRLEEELKQENKTIDSLNIELQQSVLAISQANLKINHLEDQHRKGENALEILDSALTGGPAPPQQYLSLSPPLSPTGLNRMVQGSTPNDLDNSHDAFENVNSENKSAAFSDPFKDDPFASNSAQDDPFAPAFSSNRSTSGFASDPFASSFGNSTPDPFGGDAFESTKDNKNKQQDDNKDPFGCDPFAILHAPTRDGPSPTPSLPPKKHKQPPPRPAPPRPQQPSFNADFSNFNKLSSKRPTPTANESKSKSPMDFTEDPFRNYRYEDPYNLEDPFASIPGADDVKKKIEFNTAVDTFDSHAFDFKPGKTDDFASFGGDDFFPASFKNGTTSSNGADAFGGRQSVPLPPNDPFNKSGRVSAPIVNKPTWSAWDDNSNSKGWAASDDNWITSDAFAKSTSADDKANNNLGNRKKNYETWSVSHLKSDKSSKTKKEKPPKSENKIKLPWGSLSKNKDKDKSNNNIVPTPNQISEERQLAWAAAEGKKLEEERRLRREREERELQIAMALSIENR